MWLFYSLIFRTVGMYDTYIVNKTCQWIYHIFDTIVTAVILLCQEPSSKKQQHMDRELAAVLQDLVIFVMAASTHLGISCTRNRCLSSKLFHMLEAKFNNNVNIKLTGNVSYSLTFCPETSEWATYFIFLWFYTFSDASFGMCTDLFCSSVPSGTPFEISRRGICAPN